MFVYHNEPGAYCSSKSYWLTRIVAAAWCLGSFVIFNSYNTTLISYVTAPLKDPLVKTIYDVKDKPEVKVIVDRGLSLQILILVGTILLQYYYRFSY